jgi:peptide/nickel transport system permease protein
LTRIIARRVVASVAMLLLLTLVTFWIFKAVKLDPACLRVYCGQGMTATPTQLHAIDHRLGADQSVLVQFKEFVWRIVRHGSFGTSWSNYSIDRTLRQAVGQTISVLAGGAILLLLLAIPLGILSALHPNTLLDRGILFGTIFGIALHPLIVGYLLRQVFGATLHVLPSSFYCSLAKPRPIVLPPNATHASTLRSVIPCHGLGPWSSHLVLPWLTFALFFLPLYVRLIRARVLETFAEPHVSTARAKGGSELHVILRHVLRPALVPLTPMIAMDLGGALMAVIYIEVVFNLGGIGSIALSSLSPDRTGYDLPLIAALFFVIASFIVLLNLVADIVQAAADPRIRTSAA